MSGIFGIIRPEGAQALKQRLQRMSSAMRSRGPDGENFYITDTVGLGHRMLCTTPESYYEHLPFQHPESNCIITSDARLDNREELIHGIGKHEFRTEMVPDSMVILQAYLKWGDSCVNKLLGDFSFAIWDSNKQRLFCARDHLGVKPFNYYLAENIFVFCSEAAAIAKHAGFTTTINEGRIADSLTPHLEGFDKVSTFYKEVFRLEPGHTLTLSENRKSISEYWKPVPQEALRYCNDDEYCEALQEILNKAVACRTRAMRVPAMLLSGGIDSASIMAVAQQHHQQNSNKGIHTYSGISQNITHCRESRMISALTTSKDSHHYIYTPSDIYHEGDTFFELISEVQEPFDITMILHFLLYSKASKNGDRIVLDGVDGDLITSLPASYPVNLLRMGKYRKAFNEIRSLNKLYCNKDGLISKFLVRNILSATTPQIFKNIRWKRGLMQYAETIIKESPISPNYSEHSNVLNRLVTFEKHNRTLSPTFPADVYINRFRHPFLTVGLERYDRVAALCSVEPRHPLLDKRLIDFFTRLPWDQFVRNGRTKHLLRTLGEKHLPPEVCWRLSKEHVGWKFNEEFQKVHNKKIHHVVNKHGLNLRKIVKTDFLFLEYSNKPTIIDSAVAGLAIWINNLERQGKTWNFQSDNH